MKARVTVILTVDLFSSISDFRICSNYLGEMLNDRITVIMLVIRLVFRNYSFLLLSSMIGNFFVVQGYKYRKYCMDKGPELQRNEL